MQELVQWKRILLFPSREECAREIDSSLHSTPQISHHWPIGRATKAISTLCQLQTLGHIKTHFICCHFLLWKRKSCYWKPLFFSASTNESVFSAIFCTPVACACPVWPPPAEMNAAVLHSVHTNGSTRRVLNVLQKLLIVATLVLYVSASPLTVLFQDRGIPGDSAAKSGNLKLQNKTEVTKNLFEVS